MNRFLRSLILVLCACYILLTITTSVWQPTSEKDKVRPATRPYEFDYTFWTIDALADKISMLGAGFEHYLTDSQERTIVRDYFQLARDTGNIENSIESIFSNPSIKDPDQESAKMRANLAVKQAALAAQSSLAEVVIQNQISTMLYHMQIQGADLPFPPVLYRATELPKELIISPRNVIELTESISLNADINLNEITALEKKVEANTDYSALVVPIGGVGVYPTMVADDSSLSYMLDTVAHEWTHNYLDIRPLGIHFSDSSAMRTMNETTATIVGDEIGQAVLQQNYSDLLKPTTQPITTFDASYHENLMPRTQSAAFDFRLEMYNTRLKVDQLLAQGQVKEAEDYMEERRELFWENGYQIRKLNQAYFAFNGAYAADTYSAAGKDPVGEAVRTLRAHSRSLTDFLHTISRMSSLDQLFTLVNTY